MAESKTDLRLDTQRPEKIVAKRQVGRVLADGQLPAAKATLYTVPTGYRVRIKFFRVYNTSGGAEDVTIWAKPGATSRVIFKSATLAGATMAEVLTNGTELALEEGDLIEGDATNATVVDYIITGDEELL